MNPKLKLKITRRNQEYLDMDFDLWDVILVVSGDTFRVAKNTIIDDDPDIEHPLYEINGYSVECHEVFIERYDVNSELTHEKVSYERIL